MSTASWRTITTKKKDGTLVSKQQVTIFFKNENGERKRKSKLFPVDRDLSTTVRRRNALRAFVSELEAKQEKEIAKAEERTHIEARQKEEALRMESTPTVTACIRAYIDKAKLGLAGTTDHGIEGATILDYERTARRLEPHFRDVLITDLKPIAISEWEVAQISEGVSRNAIGKCHRLLNAACGEAVRMGQIELNPMTAVKAPKRVKPRPNSLEQEQMRDLTARLLEMDPTPVATAAFLACA